jgi:hypothetical protein
MALRVCLECTTRYSADAGCPHCGSTAWVEEGTDEAGKALEPEPVAVEESDEE